MSGDRILTSSLDGVGPITPFRMMEKLADGSFPTSRPSRRRPAATSTSLTMILAAGLTFAVGILLYGSYVNIIDPIYLLRNQLGSVSVEERALRVLKKNPLIDGHNDLMILIRMLYHNHIYGEDFKNKFENGGMEMHVDIPRLDEGRSGGAFWSAYMPCPENGTDFSNENYYNIVRATLEQLDLFHRLGAQYPRYFTPTPSHASALSAFKHERLISPTAIEGLHQIGNSLSTLRLYHSLGVRYATLTWNCHNIYADAAVVQNDAGDSVRSTPFWGGVSNPAGRDLIREMNRLGMLVDLAHVSPDTMRDVLAGRPADSATGDAGWTGSLAPPIFSHSSAYAICPHPRNVPDEILDLVKQRNSVVMINFSPGFVACVDNGNPSGLPDVYEPNVTLAQVVRHIRHIGERIGYDHVGIGSDFDGIEYGPKGLEDVSKFPDLVAELLRQGVSEKDAGNLVGRNLLRVWKEVDKVAAKLQKTMLPFEDDISNSWFGPQKDVDEFMAMDFSE